MADAWRPTSELERRLHESVRAGDQEGYFRVLADSELVLPVPPDVVDDVLANTAQPTWPTQEEDGRVHVLTYTSAAAMRACLGPAYKHFMTLRFGDIAQSWPDAAWWLAVDVPGHGVDAALPIEARLPSWFVRQVAEGDGRPPRVGRPGAPADGPWEELRGQHRDLPRESRRPEFQPANDVERELLRAAANNDHDLFLQTLAGTEVLLPVPEDTDYSLRPGRPGFPWQTRDVDGATVVPVFTSPERLIEAARAAGTGTEYIRLPFTVALRYWPHPDWQLAINSGSPAGGTVQAQQLPGLATWADQRAAQRMTEGFEPQNEVEQRLFDAARRRDTDAFYKILLGAQVLVPADPDTPWGVTPDDPAFPWQPVNVHGRTSIQVFTSPKWMNDALSSSRFVMPTLLDMLAAWPDTAWTFVLNPGTPIDASLPGDQVRALAGRAVPEEPATPPSAATPPPPDAPAVPVAPPVPAAPEPSDADPARTASDALDALGTRVAPEGPGTAWPQHDPSDERLPDPARAATPEHEPAPGAPGDTIGWPRHDAPGGTGRPGEGPEHGQAPAGEPPQGGDMPQPVPSAQGPVGTGHGPARPDGTAPPADRPGVPETGAPEAPTPAHTAAVAATPGDLGDGRPHELPGRPAQPGGAAEPGPDRAGEPAHGLPPATTTGAPQNAAPPGLPEHTTGNDDPTGTATAHHHGPANPQDTAAPPTGGLDGLPGQPVGTGQPPFPEASGRPAETGGGHNLNPATPTGPGPLPTPEAPGNPPQAGGEPGHAPSTHGPAATTGDPQNAAPRGLPGHTTGNDDPTGTTAAHHHGPANPQNTTPPAATTDDLGDGRPSELPGQPAGNDQPAMPGASSPTHDRIGAAAAHDDGPANPQNTTPPAATTGDLEDGRPHELPGRPAQFGGAAEPGHGVTPPVLTSTGPLPPSEAPGNPPAHGPTDAPENAAPLGLPGHEHGEIRTGGSADYGSARPEETATPAATTKATEDEKTHGLPARPAPTSGDAGYGPERVDAPEHGVNPLGPIGTGAVDNPPQGSGEPQHAPPAHVPATVDHPEYAARHKSPGQTPGNGGAEQAGAVAEHDRESANPQNTTPPAPTTGDPGDGRPSELPSRPAMPEASGRPAGAPDGAEYGPVRAAEPDHGPTSATPTGPLPTPEAPSNPPQGGDELPDTPAAHDPAAPTSAPEYAARHESPGQTPGNGGTEQAGAVAEHDNEPANPQNTTPPAATTGDPRDGRPSELPGHPAMPEAPGRPAQVPDGAEYGPDRADASQHGVNPPTPIGTGPLPTPEAPGNPPQGGDEPRHGPATTADAPDSAAHHEFPGQAGTVAERDYGPASPREATAPGSTADRPDEEPGGPMGDDPPSAVDGPGRAGEGRDHGRPAQSGGPHDGTSQGGAADDSADARPRGLPGRTGGEQPGDGGRGLRAVPDAEPAFEPGNRLDQELYDATLAGDSDAFLRVLLNANVLVPIPEDAPLEVTPIQRDFRWDAALRDDAAVRVFTSLVRLREVLPEEARFVYADFRELIGAWPRADWAMLLNPGTRIGASLRGEQVRALSEWAIRVGLIQARPEAPPPREPEPQPRAEARPAALPQPGADPDDRVSQLAIMQKVVPHGHVGWYLEQGYDRVGGFVHLTSDVAELQTPAQLYEALGLLYDDSPFTPGDEGVYVIRWPAYCPDVYRVPFGGATEAEMAAWGEAGWVVERAPFVGTGFAPGSAGSIREFKVDSIRLPYGSEMYYIAPDRSERFVAMYDPDRLGWLRPEAGTEGWDGRTEAAQ